MENLINKVKSNLREAKDEHLFDNFISSFSSREERHYCAYLFSWLMNDSNAIKTYFENHSNKNDENFPSLEKVDFSKTIVYYEYTALRELLDLIGRKVKTEVANKLKSETKERLEEIIFIGHEGDIQKKKPDLVFYFPDEKFLILIEAKFEMEFDESQILESQRYGETLMKIYSNDIKVVYTTVLGTEYQLDKLKTKHPSISWEKIHDVLLEPGKIKAEILRGLNYQSEIRKNTMKDWKLKEKI
jgi:hypothetical protein